jgi:hypothetical protein
MSKRISLFLLLASELGAFPVRTASSAYISALKRI